jgi:hypothetical protein
MWLPHLPAVASAQVSAECGAAAGRLGAAARTDRGGGSGRAATWSEEWVLEYPDGRAVAVVRAGGGGSPRSVAGVRGAPTPAELAVLRACAGVVERSAGPSDALSRAPSWPVRGAPGALAVVPSAPIPFGPVVARTPQRRSWAPADAAPEEADACPCWEVFDGAAFVEGPAPAPGLRVWTTTARNLTTAFAVDVPGGQRFAGVAGGEVAWVGTRAGTELVAARDPFDPPGVTVFLVDRAAGHTLPLVLPGAEFPVTWDGEGLTVTVDGAPRRVALP